MSYAVYAAPAASAPVELRVSFLRKVAALTLGGLAWSGLCGVVTAGAISMIPALSGSLIPTVLVFGCYVVAHFAAREAVFRFESAPLKLAAFAVGATSEGVAMGYLLLWAMTVSVLQYGNPLVFVFQAMGLVGLTTMGLFVYLMSGPKQLSMVKGALAMLTLPMLALMALTLVAPFVMPLGGLIGIGLSAVFVVVSAAGLLVQLNSVMHELPANRAIEGAYVVMMGLLVLFWNVLVLILKLQNRR